MVVSRESSSSPTSDMPPIRPEPQKWIVGKQYPVVPGELFYMSIRNGLACVFCLCEVSARSREAKDAHMSFETTCSE
jgi:hypothetical protein